jgi:acetyl-CoA acetyltransferase
VTVPLERNTAISGIGQSEVGRELAASPISLTIDACLEAIADAGLEPRQIDGLATYPGAHVDVPRGFGGPGVAELQDALRLELGWYTGGIELAGPLGAVLEACLAVGAGLAKHVLCFRTVFEGSARKYRGKSEAPKPAVGPMQWVLPFRAYSSASWIAMYAQRHFHQYGTTREQLAQVALTARAHAQKNERAIYRDPMTLEQYLAARPISTPFGLYDCDIPVDGATAVVVSALDEAKALRHPPLRIEAIGTGIRGRPSWDQWSDLTTMAARDAAAMMWSRTSLTPADVDVAELYDGFSFLALAWLEALGFCKPGEGGPFIEDGRRIALDGPLPLNTGGGQLSAGRLHGFGLLHEACIQLRGLGGAHQVSRGPELAVVSAGGGPYAACLLLSAS